VTVGHFSQDVGEMSGRTAVEETMDGAGPVSKVAAEMHALEHAGVPFCIRHAVLEKGGERAKNPMPYLTKSQVGTICNR
jgi:hypothetical protein